MLQRGEHIALNKNTKEIVPCIKLDCEDCLFSRRYNWSYDCTLNRTKWLVEEYTKAEVDWSKVSVDTAVLISVRIGSTDTLLVSTKKDNLQCSVMGQHNGVMDTKNPVILNT